MSQTTTGTSPLTDDILISADYSNDHLGTKKFYSVLAKHVIYQWRDPNFSTHFLFSFPRAKYRFLSQENYLGEWKVSPMTTIVSFIKETLNYINNIYKRYCEGLPPLGRYIIVDHSMPWWTCDSANVDVSIPFQEMKVSTNHGTVIAGKERIVSLDSNTNRTAENATNIRTKQSINQGEMSPRLFHGFHTISPIVLHPATPQTEGESQLVKESPSQSIVSSKTTDTAEPFVESNRPFKKRKFRLKLSDTVQNVCLPTPLQAKRAAYINYEIQQTRTPHIIPQGQVRSTDISATSVVHGSPPIGAISSPHRFQRMNYEFHGVRSSILNPCVADVLLFGQCHGHPGNKRLYSAILSQLKRRPLYSSQDKLLAVMDVIDTISRANGRFLARGHHGHWQKVDESVVQQYVLRGVVYISNRHCSQHSRQNSSLLPSTREGVATRYQVRSFTFRMNCIRKEREIRMQLNRNPCSWIPEATSRQLTPVENVISLSPQPYEETLIPTLLFGTTTQNSPLQLPCLPKVQRPLVAGHMRPDVSFSSGGVIFLPPRQEQPRVGLVRDSTMVQQLVDRHSVRSTTKRNTAKKVAKSVEE